MPIAPSSCGICNPGPSGVLDPAVYQGRSPPFVSHHEWIYFIGLVFDHSAWSTGLGIAVGIAHLLCECTRCAPSVACTSYRIPRFKLVCLLRWNPMQRQLAHGYRGYESNDNVRLYPGTQPDAGILDQRKPWSRTHPFYSGGCCRAENEKHKTPDRCRTSGGFRPRGCSSVARDVIACLLRRALALFLASSAVQHAASMDYANTPQQRVAQPSDMPLCMAGLHREPKLPEVWSEYLDFTANCQKKNTRKSE